MVFRGRRLSDLQEQHLQRLVDDKVQERDTVEYKRDMYGKLDSDKREMLKDITSIANHRGGYLLIGIDEDDEGIPTNVLGIESGNHDERIRSSCLDNIDKRIVGLEIRDIPLVNGRVVIVVSVPESINAPHMITHQGVNQFWRRHGRQKDKMTIDEIGEAFDRRLSNLNRLDRFLFTRKAQILEKIGNQTQIVMSASPAYLRDEIVFDKHDDNLRQMILNPPQQLTKDFGWLISCGQPYPTINGLRADQSTPYYDDPSFDKYIEVFHNGYVEFGIKIWDSQNYGKRIFSQVEIPLIVNFMRFIQSIYEQYLPLTPLVVSLSVFNAEGIWLVVSNHSVEDSRVKWQEQHLELGKFYAENISEERGLLTKAICDRLYQAFNRGECNLVDGAGTFGTS